jgi:hypothetical protein
MGRFHRIQGLPVFEDYTRVGEIMYLEGSMKKLFVFLLCLVAVAGFVFAGDIHPPGAPSLEVALPGYGVDYAAVTPDMVLIMETMGRPDQILAVSNMIENGLPQTPVYNDLKSQIFFIAGDYFLRL